MTLKYKVIDEFKFHKSARILVTGGTGFLGSYILRTLVKNGYSNIIATHRSSSKFDLVQAVKNEIDWTLCDLSDIADLEILLKESDVVIHAAAIVSFDGSNKTTLFATNVELTASLIDLSLVNGVKRFLYISSIAALGRSESDELIDENADWTDSPLNSDYAISKRLGELEVWRGSAEGLPVCIINPSLIIGAGYWSTGTPSMFTKVHNGVGFYPSGGNGVVDVRDVAKAVVIALEKNIVEKRIIINEQNITYKELLTSMANGLNVSGPSRPLPSFLLKLIDLIEPIFKLFNWSYKGVSIQQLKILQSHSRYDSNLSKELLSLDYISIEITIEETAELFQSYQKSNETNIKVLDV